MFYYTVRFTGHGDKYIVKQKCINLVSDKFCVAKYKGCWYDAEILDSGNNFEILQARMCTADEPNNVLKVTIASTQSSNVKISQPDDASTGSILNTVLLNQNWFSAFQLIIKYRNEAGVDKASPYVLGISGGHMNDNHLLACNLIQNFALDCGSEYPDTLRGTLLRKLIATVVQMLNLTTSDMALFSNFMDHNEKIHNAHYRLLVQAKAIEEMSNLLSVIERGDINKYKDLNLEQMCHDTDSFINEPPEI